MVAVAGVVFVESALERVEAAAVVDQAGDVELGTDEVSHDAAVVVERGNHYEVHEGRAVSPTERVNVRHLAIAFGGEGPERTN